MTEQLKPLRAWRNRNEGHGHVFERPDGVRMRCGGYGLCPVCAKDLAQLQAAWNTRPAPKVKPLVWDDFDGGGAKARGFYHASYIITYWRGRCEFEVSMSYPGYQTGYDGKRFHQTIEDAKAAAEADYKHRILDALE